MCQLLIGISFCITLLIPMNLFADNIQYLDGPIEGMYFVTIPAGSFQMGSPNQETGRLENEGPQHTVYLDSFELLTTEVTQGMWEIVMGNSVVDMQNLSENVSENVYGNMNIGSDVPMYYLNYYDCLEFIDALNELDPLFIYRLPSEAEWEYACRAGTTTPYYWGNSSFQSTMNQYCWYDRNAHNLNAHPVAQLSPNAWGLFDMSGNVWEWCADWWNDSYDNWSGAPTDGSAWTQGDFSSFHILRGGSSCNEAAHCRSAVRNGIENTERHNTGGFRVVRENANVVNANRLVSEGMASLLNEDYNQAISYCEQALELVPDNVDALLLQGISYSLNENYILAIDNCNQVIDLTPDNAFAYTVRGSAYTYSGDYEKAISDYEYCMELDSTMKTSVLYSYACLYGLSNDPVLSIQYLEQAVYAGYDNLEWIESDSDFDFVRETLVFREGMDRIRAYLE